MSKPKRDRLTLGVGHLGFGLLLFGIGTALGVPSV
jgi:hypothetical protein